MLQGRCIYFPKEIALRIGLLSYYTTSCSKNLASSTRFSAQAYLLSWYNRVYGKSKFRDIGSRIGPKQQVETVLELTAEGNTIPFIARYRKEKTGNLDETQIKAIIDMDKSLTALQDRKETVLAKIEAQGKLTDQLKAAIEAAEKLADVEELYLPYKEKRRTKATIAREAGLFPLARLILQNSSNLKDEAEKLTSEAFPTADKALAGAVDILVEAFSEDNSLRSWTYNEIWNNSEITFNPKGSISG